MQLSRTDIEQLDRKWRLNLINSISGIKPANLVGTRSLEGIDNVAIFSSVVHLGSNPAQLGFVARPYKDTSSNTLGNIQQTSFYTINHITESFIKKAHYTSAKLPKTTSEFDQMKIERTFLADFFAPFVKDSPVKIGMRHLKSIPLPNKCTFVVGTIEVLFVPESALNELGRIDLADYNGVGIAGLNTYYGLNKLDSFPYVRLNELPEFE